MPPSKKTKEPEEYIVEKLVDMKLEGKKKLFLVKWKGYSSKQNTWEPVANLKGFKEEMEELERNLIEAEDDKADAKKRGKPAPTPSAPPERKAAKQSRMAVSGDNPKKRGGESPANEGSAKRAKTTSSDKAPPKGKKPFLDVVALAEQLKAEVTGKNSGKRPAGKERPEKTEKKSREKPSDVVEVDKILAVKANVKGGLMYQIQWMDGTKTWEPEDNVMDDDLIDDFEAAEQAKAYSGDEIKVGSEVEVKNIMEGFENSWSAASVIKKEKGNKFTVEFAGFVDDETGDAETEAGVERERLRLVPDEAVKGWAPIVGEIIEVNEDDCWWEARVMEINGKKAKLQLRVSDEFKNSTIGTKKLRPCGWLHMAGKSAKS